MNWWHALFGLQHKGMGRPSSTAAHTQEFVSFAQRLKSHQIKPPGVPQDDALMSSHAANGLENTNGPWIAKIPGLQSVAPAAGHNPATVEPILSGELLAAFGTTACQNAVTANRGASFTKAVAPFAHELTGLISPFHRENSGL